MGNGAPLRNCHASPSVRVRRHSSLDSCSATTETPRPRLPMKFIESVFHKLQRHPKRIVFPEGTEPRVLRAAERFVTLKLGTPVLLGNKAAIEKAAADEGTSLDHVMVIDPATADD